MRVIKYIAVHCTATQPTAKIADIQRYWREQLKWKYPGYHYIIKADGETVQLLDLATPSNGVADYNSQIINISYIGGIDKAGLPKDTRTPEQKAALTEILTKLKRMFPNAVIQGHRDFPKVAKACPSFDAKREYSNIK